MRHAVARDRDYSGFGRRVREPDRILDTDQEDDRLADDIVRLLARGNPRGIGGIGSQLTYASRQEIAESLAKLEAQGAILRIRGRLFIGAADRSRNTTRERVIHALSKGYVYRVPTIAKALGESTALIWYHIWSLIGSGHLDDERLGKKRFVWLTPSGIAIQAHLPQGQQPITKAPPVELRAADDEPRVAALIILHKLRTATVQDVEAEARVRGGIRVRGAANVLEALAVAGLAEPSGDEEPPRYHLTERGARLAAILNGEGRS